MTNADIIRSMTDEQLYEFLSEWELQDIDYAVTFCDLCEQGKREGGKGNELGLDCDGCRKHFLTVDADGYLGLNGWLRHNGFEPYREGGDAISRLYTLKAMCAECDVKCEDGTNKEAYCTEYAIVKSMPPVEPKRPKGEWVSLFDGNEWFIHCSQCKTQHYEEDLLMGESELPDFCPNCGADLRGDKDV